MIFPDRLGGWFALAASVTSTCSPRAWVRIWARGGLWFRLMAKLASVRSIGSWLSYVTAATRPLGERSRSVIDLMRSFTSCSGNERSTRASPSTSPLRVK